MRAFSAGSTMPAVSNRISTMLPGTMRSRVKMITEMPNNVSNIRPKRRSRYAPKWDSWNVGLGAGT